MALTLDQALARVPMWRGARDLKTSPLGGGITNQNFRVDVGGESFVLRISGADTELLGIDRRTEYVAHRAAASIGIAPEVAYFIEPEGYLVTRFLNARPIPRDEMQKPENIRRVASTLKQYHALPAIPAAFSPFRTIEQYAAIARQYNVEFPANFDWLMASVSEIEAAFARDPFTPRPCHNDLLNENFLDDGTLRVRIIDWEYAGMGDPAFDLANFAVHHQLNDEQEKILLEEYYRPLPLASRHAQYSQFDLNPDRVTTCDQPLSYEERGVARSPSILEPVLSLPKEKGLGVRLARHKLLKIVSDTREAMWAMVQIGISRLDFDFRAYADKHFTRAEQMIHDARYAEYLAQV